MSEELPEYAKREIMFAEFTCQQELIIAYIEGELDSSSQIAFEQHLESCDSCRGELTDQRLLLCELNAALSQSPTFQTPTNFAQIVTARAETDMRGVRTFAEHKRALRLILILGIAAFSLLGLSAGEVIFGRVRLLTLEVYGLTVFLSGAIYDAGASLIVISKVLSRKLLIESGSSGLSILFLVLAVFLLARLITTYHRTHAVE
ncbi:MAG TPA: zf-HC2 domain-containing protein [Pyrinomonadaceae bacterium]